MKVFIVSPGYKPKEYINPHIGSILSQINCDYVKIHHILATDDDEYSVSIPSWYKRHYNVSVIEQTGKHGALYSHINIMNRIASTLSPDKNDIIVHLDQDDWLFHPFSLSTLINKYENPKIWATYGSYVSLSGERCICKPMTKPFNRIENGFNWQYSHLRTFRYGLWEHIRKDSLLDNNNIPFQMAGDVAIYSSILELCSINNIKYIDLPLVVYNDLSPLNENKLNLSLQQSCMQSIIQKPPHEVLQQY